MATSPAQTALAFGAGKAIYVATSTDEGKSFSSPVKVVEAEVLPLSRHRGPRVAISNGAIIVTAVVGEAEEKSPHSHGLPSDGELFAWRSTDGGKSWSKGTRINDVPSAAREGLHALSTDGRGNLFAVWLDLRKSGTQLYGALSKDSGATWSPNRLVYRSPDGSICQCCHPSAAYATNGAIEIMWRNCVGDARDFYLIRSKDGVSFGEPEKLGTGTWKINACPMDGGGLTHDGKRTVTAWRREGDIFMAEPGKPEKKLGEGKDAAIASSRGEIYVFWLSGGELKLWKDSKAESLAQGAAFPSAVALPGGGVLAAWEESGGITIRRLP